MNKTNLEKAKETFLNGDFTCVLCKDDTTITSDKMGIAPMMEFIEKNVDLQGFSVCDKIVGKAVAMLFVLAGITEVFATVISQSAVDFLEKNNVSYSYETLTDKIINRSGDGICPMEMTVENISKPQEAYTQIKNTIKKLRNGVK